MAARFGLWFLSLVVTAAALAADPPAGYVGSETCKQCHEESAITPRRDQPRQDRGRRSERRNGVRNVPRPWRRARGRRRRHHEDPRSPQLAGAGAVRGVPMRATSAETGPTGREARTTAATCPV